MSKKQTTTKTTNIVRVFSSDTKRVLTNLLSNAITLIENDELTDGFGLGFLAAHLEAIAELTDDDRHFRDALIGECSDRYLCIQLQAGEDWQSIVSQVPEHGHIDTSVDELQSCIDNFRKVAS